MARMKPGFMAQDNHPKTPEDVLYNTESSQNARYDVQKDVFGDETDNGIKYRTLTWPLVAFLMITEIVTVSTTYCILVDALITLLTVRDVVIAVFAHCGWDRARNHSYRLSRSLCIVYSVGIDQIQDQPS